MRGLFFITGNLLLYKFSKSLTVTSRITVFRMARESALLPGVTFTLIDDRHFINCHYWHYLLLCYNLIILTNVCLMFCAESNLAITMLLLFAGLNFFQ